MDDGETVGTEVLEKQKQGEETSPKRVLLLVAGGGVLIYLSTWLGALTFYLSFQRDLSDLKGTMLWRVPVVMEADGVVWGRHEIDGLRVLLPPGELLETEREGAFLKASFKEGEVRLQLLEKGTLGLLHREMERKLMSSSFAGVLSDAAALMATAREDPRRYRFSWPAAERREYAVRLLCKRLLWDDRPVRRSVVARHPTSGSAAVLVEYEDGEVKVIATGDEGVLVARLPAGVPETWKSSPGPWLSDS